MTAHQPTPRVRRVSDAQRRVLDDLARGGTGHGRHVTATVVPMRCLIRDGLVATPARRGDRHELTDAGRAALAAARDADRTDADRTDADPADGAPAPVDLDDLIARHAGEAG